MDETSETKGKLMKSQSITKDVMISYRIHPWDIKIAIFLIVR
jgi:hypothetical protein